MIQRQRLNMMRNGNGRNARMEFITPISGQSLQLMVIDEMRPLRGGPFLPDLVAAIAGRYRFVKIPDAIYNDQQEPIKYYHGVLHTRELTIPIQSLEIYRDGVIVNSRSTEDSDEILGDFTVWMTEALNLRQPTTHVPRNYQSQLVVELSQSLDGLLVGFQKLNKILCQAFGSDADLSMTRLTIGPHPAGVLPYQRTWNIEARIDQPFVPNRYVSTAPLPTFEHLNLLAKLEEAMG